MSIFSFTATISFNAHSPFSYACLSQVIWININKSGVCLDWQTSTSFFSCKRHALQRNFKYKLWSRQTFRCPRRHKQIRIRVQFYSKIIKWLLALQELSINIRGTGQPSKEKSLVLQMPAKSSEFTYIGSSFYFKDWSQTFNRPVYNFKRSSML